MDKISQLVFNQQKIVSYNTLTAELGKPIDDASTLLYQFYSANKSKLATYFLVILNGSTEESITIERLSGKELLGTNTNISNSKKVKLNNTEYQNKIKQIKLWAVCDKNIEEFGIDEIYQTEQKIPRESQHGIHEISQKLRVLKLEETPPSSQNDKKLKPQLSKSSSFGEEKSVNKQETPAGNQLLKKGSFETNKPAEKKENNPLERKNTAEFGKKPSFVEEKPPVVQQEKAKPTENKKKKATADPTEESEQPLKKTKITKEKEENANAVRPKIDGGINSFFKKTEKKPTTKIEEEVEEDIPIADTNEANLDEYFKHKKPSNDTTEDPFINISVKPKQAKISTEEESYYDGYIEEPVRERSPNRENDEHKPKKNIKRESQPSVPANYVQQRAPETRTENGKTFERKTKTVMVEKTYMDEKGYLVSEQVPTLEEVWEEVRKPLNQTQHLSQTQTQSDKKQPDKNQKSLTSFFKKM